MKRLIAVVMLCMFCLLFLGFFFYIDKSGNCQRQHKYDWGFNYNTAVECLKFKNLK